MKIDKINEAITELLPRKFSDGVKRNIDAIVKSNFAKMNLVTREQMQIQEKVLQRTRQQLEDLEVRIDALEKRQNPPSG